MPPTSFDRAFNFKGSDNCHSERTRKMPRTVSGLFGGTSNKNPQRSQPCQRRATEQSFPSLTRRRSRRFEGGRPIKFTPERMEQIKNLVERGIGREEIAETIGVTLGSLQVTCSKHGISLRRPRPPIADRIGRSGPWRSTKGRSARGPQANRSAVAGRHDRPT